MNVNTSQNDTGVIKGDFKSCRVVREENGSILSQVTLLPVKFAQLGKQLELSDKGVWTTWMVLNVSSNVITDPVDPRVLVKSHRRATGDSLPKRTK